MTDEDQAQRPDAFGVAAVQMVSGRDLDANLATAARMIAQAVGGGARLVVLPEHFACFPVRGSREIGAAESGPEGPVRSFLRGQARSHGIWLVGGSLPVQDEASGRVYAASFVIDEAGNEVGRYDKMHLFDVDIAGEARPRYRESDDFAPGAAPLIVETPFCRLGVIVCYDLRFPELTRAMALDGMDVLAVPSAFTATTGRAHWELLVRARAVENLAWVVAADQGGMHPGQRETWGHSMVVEPWGGVVASCGSGEQVVPAMVSPAVAARHRAQFPVLGHTRLRITR